MEHHNEGVSIKELAVKFGRKQSTIIEIIEGQKKAKNFFDWNTAGDPFINGVVNKYQ